MVDKKGFTLFILICIFSHSMRGQPNLVNTYEAFAGFGLLTNHGNQYYQLDSNPKFGGTVGVLAGHAFSELFKLKLGLSLDRKGYSSAESGIIDIVSNRTLHFRREKDITYLSILAIPTVQLGAKRRIGLGAGIFYSFLLKAQGTFVTIDESSGNVLVNRSGDTSNSVSDDIGVVLNASYRLAMGRTTIDLRLQENFGIFYYTESFGYPIKSGLTCVMVSVIIPNRHSKNP